MKICDFCNFPIADGTSYCSNCGSRVTAKKKGKEPISVGGWIGRSLIPFIPLVGGIVYLVMLFIWSGDTTKEKTFRNWAKAQLILMAIAIVFAVIFVIFASVISADVINTYSSMMA